MNIKTQALQVSHAFHSRLLDPMLPEFANIAELVTFNNPHIPLISNLTGQLIKPGEINADYWVRHTREPVDYKENLEVLAEAGCNIFIEIGPQPTLLSMVSDHSISENKTLWLPSLRRSRGDSDVILNSLAKLYQHGINIDWNGFDKPYLRRKVILPTYPFQRECYWPVIKTTTLKPENKNSFQPIDFINSYYECVWQAQPIQNTPQLELTGHWLIFSNQSELVEKMKANGASCIVVNKGDDFKEVSPNHYSVNPAHKENLIELISQVTSTISLLSLIHI